MSEHNEDHIEKLVAAKQKRRLAKRFYKSASISSGEPPYCVLLDERRIKTPMKADLTVPVQALGEAVAKEWHDQVDEIDPASMPLTRLCNTAIDRVSTGPEAIVVELTEFAGSDLVCYRAERPQALVERQEAAWDHLLSMMNKSLGARFIAVAGLVHRAQPEPALAAVAGYLTGRDPFTLTALHNAATVTGSCVIAIALNEGVLGGEEAWSAAHIDEDWQTEQWGEDREAALRRISRKREFDAALRLLELVAPPKD